MFNFSYAPSSSSIALWSAGAVVLAAILAGFVGLIAIPFT
jgi:hypothetical protein